ncbi:MAG: DNA polymerase III subunit gamma/tau, partial [Armatimonadetes bacterium]|nr:DNA polymerase III subunit gamma/tau [Armatimonadota bacterium]
IGGSHVPYLSLYRKYRPRSFAEIVGQRHVTQTLANAIKANRVAHAYLFCGPRGTGKTTSALVLAMALNCEKGPTAEPCRECEGCRRIVAGNALDVIEIDAASNRGIDEIRELRERVGLAPSGGRMKVYIIDEVHMLTGEAFNAFLKTLEEPPPHVVFILATTEPHRVLPTILSRCQRFDFHRLGLSDLEGVIRDIAAKEKLKVDDKAVTMLAHAGDGSMRDSLTLLDQAIAYAEGEVTPEVVTEILGGIDFDLLADLADILIRGSMTDAFAFVERVVSEGKDLRQMVGGLIGHYRDLLLLSVDRRGREAITLPEGSAERAVEQAKSLTTAKILRTLDVLAETDRELRFTSQPRLLVELAMARICGGAETAAAEPAPPRERRAPTPAAPTPPAEPEKAVEPPPSRERRAAAPAASAPPAETEEAKEPEPAAVAKASGEVELAEIRHRWDEVIASLRKSRKTAEAAFLREAMPVALEDGVLLLEFSHLFHHDQMTEKRRELTAEAVAGVFGVAVVIKCRMASGA